MAPYQVSVAPSFHSAKLGHEVELVQTDVAPLYQGVSRGDLDVMMMAWLPETHADYFAKVKGTPMSARSGGVGRRCIV